MSTYEEHLEYKIRKTAGIVGGLQAATWIVLSLICIALYIKDLNETPRLESYMDIINYSIYMMFLCRQRFSEPFSQSLNPTTFFVFMWFYLFVDCLWLFVSFQILRNSASKYYLARTTRIWACVTLLVCLLDFITVVILGADYQKCMGVSTIEEEEFCANVILPVLVIAAKGFVLWFVNLIFAVVIYKMSLKIQGTRIPNQVQSYPTQQVAVPVNYPTGFPVNPPTIYPNNYPSGFLVNTPNSPNQLPKSVGNLYPGATPFRPFQQQTSVIRN